MTDLATRISPPAPMYTPESGAASTESSPATAAGPTAAAARALIEYVRSGTVTEGESGMSYDEFAEHLRSDLALRQRLDDLYREEAQRVGERLRDVYEAEDAGTATAPVGTPGPTRVPFATSARTAD